MRNEILDLVEIQGKGVHRRDDQKMDYPQNADFHRGLLALRIQGEEQKATTLNESNVLYRLEQNISRPVPQKLQTLLNNKTLGVFGQAMNVPLLMKVYEKQSASEILSSNIFADIQYNEQENNYTVKLELAGGQVFRSADNGGLASGWVNKFGDNVEHEKKYSTEEQYNVMINEIKRKVKSFEGKNNRLSSLQKEALEQLKINVNSNEKWDSREDFFNNLPVIIKTLGREEGDKVGDRFEETFSPAASWCKMQQLTDSFCQKFLADDMQFRVQSVFASRVNINYKGEKEPEYNEKIIEFDGSLESLAMAFHQEPQQERKELFIKMAQSTFSQAEIKTLKDSDFKEKITSNVQSFINQICPPKEGFLKKWLKSFGGKKKESPPQPTKEETAKELDKYPLEQKTFVKTILQRQKKGFFQTVFSPKNRAFNKRIDDLLRPEKTDALIEQKHMASLVTEDGCNTAWASLKLDELSVPKDGVVTKKSALQVKEATEILANRFALDHKPTEAQLQDLKGRGVPENMSELVHYMNSACHTATGRKDFLKKLSLVATLFGTDAGQPFQCSEVIPKLLCTPFITTSDSTSKDVSALLQQLQDKKPTVARITQFIRLHGDLPDVDTSHDAPMLRAARASKSPLEFLQWVKSNKRQISEVASIQNDDTVLPAIKKVVNKTNDIETTISNLKKEREALESELPEDSILFDPLMNQNDFSKQADKDFKRNFYALVTNKCGLQQDKKEKFSSVKEMFLSYKGGKGWNDVAKRMSFLNQRKMEALNNRIMQRFEGKYQGLKLPMNIAPVTQTKVEFIIENDQTIRVKMSCDLVEIKCTDRNASILFQKDKDGLVSVDSSQDEYALLNRELFESLVTVEQEITFTSQTSKEKVKEMVGPIKTHFKKNVQTILEEGSIDSIGNIKSYEGKEPARFSDEGTVKKARDTVFNFSSRLPISRKQPGSEITKTTKKKVETANQKKTRKQNTTEERPTRSRSP